MFSAHELDILEEIEIGREFKIEPLSQKSQNHRSESSGKSTKQKLYVLKVFTVTSGVAFKISSIK